MYIRNPQVPTKDTRIEQDGQIEESFTKVHCLANIHQPETTGKFNYEDTFSPQYQRISRYQGINSTKIYIILKEILLITLRGEC